MDQAGNGRGQAFRGNVPAAAERTAAGKNKKTTGVKSANKENDYKKRL